MKTFFYLYRTTAGRWRIATHQADALVACYEALAEAGIYPLRVMTVQWPERLTARKLKPLQLAIVLQQLAVALESGVSLLAALHDMADEQTGATQRIFVARLEQGVLDGWSFSESLRAMPAVSPTIVQWVAIGEKQGRLADVLHDVAAYLRHQQQMRKQIQQQLLYPLLVLLAVLGLGAFLTLVVMPILARQFMSSGVVLPLWLRGSLVLQDTLRAYGLPLFFCALVLGAGLWLWSEKYAARWAWQATFRRMVLRVPFLRPLVTLRIYVPFARLFGQLLQAGVPVGEALAALQGYFARSFFAEDMDAMALAMARGGQLSAAIAEADFVPTLGRQMLKNGEQYGRLPEALLASADYYEGVLLESVGLWLRFIEPLAIVLLGVLVLWMALGLFVPVLDSYQLLLAQ